MTSEEMEYFRQSIASHDRQIGDLVDRQAENARQIAENGRQIAELKARQSETGEQIAELKDSLIVLRDGIIAMDRHVNAVISTMGKLALLVDNHETRIGGLEGLAE
jgi:chromosome segregation ATPase